MIALAVFFVAPAACRLSRGHLCPRKWRGTLPRQPPGRRRYWAYECFQRWELLSTFLAKRPVLFSCSLCGLLRSRDVRDLLPPQLRSPHSQVIPWARISRRSVRIHSRSRPDSMRRRSNPICLPTEAPSSQRFKPGVSLKAAQLRLDGQPRPTEERVGATDSYRV